jgi:hypothetical protein
MNRLHGRALNFDPLQSGIGRILIFGDGKLRERDLLTTRSKYRTGYHEGVQNAANLTGILTESRSANTPQQISGCQDATALR